MLLNINGNYYLCNCFEVWRGLITYFGTEGSVYVFSIVAVEVTRLFGMDEG